jgi:hypothetical protein
MITSDSTLQCSIHQWCNLEGIVDYILFRFPAQFLHNLWYIRTLKMHDRIIAGKESKAIHWNGRSSCISFLCAAERNKKMEILHEMVKKGGDFREFVRNGRFPTVYSYYNGTAWKVWCIWILSKLQLQAKLVMSCIRSKQPQCMIV